MDFPEIGRSNKRLKDVRHLTVPSKREKIGRFLLEGVRVTEEALSSPVRLDFLLCADNASEKAKNIAQKASCLGVEVFSADSHILDSLSDAQTSQGLLGVAYLPNYSEDEVMTGKSLLILDGIQDPGNVGTLLRSALAFGFGGALLISGGDPYNAKAVRASAGACFKLPLLRFQRENAVKILEKVLARGFHLVVAAAHNGEPLSKAFLPAKPALIMGAEVEGISDQVMKFPHSAVSIALSSQSESLNVAAAGAVLMYEINRQLDNLA